MATGLGYRSGDGSEGTLLVTARGELTVQLVVLSQSTMAGDQQVYGR